MKKQLGKSICTETVYLVTGKHECNSRGARLKLYVLVKKKSLRVELAQIFQNKNFDFW